MCAVWHSCLINSAVDTDLLDAAFFVSLYDVSALQSTYEDTLRKKSHMLC